MLGPAPGGDGLAGSFRLPQAVLQDLLRGGWEGAEAPLSRPLYVHRGRRNKILAHEDVRLGVERLLRQPLTIDAIRLRLIEAYGADRTPSRTTIGDYVRRRRIELGLQPGGRPSIRK